jgi:hypothetical protein
MRHEANGERLEVASSPLPARILHVEPDEPDPADAIPMNEKMEGMIH